MDREFEMKQIKAAIDAVMNHFGKYVIDCNQHWPRCYLHGSEMCQVIKRGENSYFVCFEIDEEGHCCGHKEFGV